MKKILIILNESRIPQHLIKTAVGIAKETNAMLEAVFMNDTSSLNGGYPFPNDLYFTGTALLMESRSEEAMNAIENDIKLFKDACDEYKVAYKIEVNKSVSIKHLIDLSLFADLIIADSKSDSEDYDIKDLLIDAHCPLLLVSRLAEAVKKIFLSYDGSTSSMYAIKMFSYIFPEYKNLPTQFFHIAGDVGEIPHLDEIKTWAAKHFTNLDFKLITGNTRKELVEHIRPGSESSVIVMGAYSGSSISRLFLKSMADSVINETHASLFITHE